MVALRICVPLRRCLKGEKSPAMFAGSLCPVQPWSDAAEEEGLAKIFIAAGFEWRQSGCSMCLAMNEDVLSPGDRCASGTNRNFHWTTGRWSKNAFDEPGDGCGGGGSRVSGRCSVITSGRGIRWIHLSKLAGELRQCWNRISTPM